VAPRRLFAKETGVVPTIIQAASKAKIEVNRLRRNIAVQEGSGGNIAVLTGKDGKLLIDAGFTASRPRISPALDSLSVDPITRLINTHWHFDHTDGNAWLHAEGEPSRRMRTPGSTYRLRLASITGAIPSHPAPSEALPTMISRDAHRLRHNDTALALQYDGPAE
jgi:glyoxylase-like metal-dependent hydrolase (beta-lactamase superfamily II)